MHDNHRLPQARITVDVNKCSNKTLGSCFKKVQGHVSMHRFTFGQLHCNLRPFAIRFDRSVSDAAPVSTADQLSEVHCARGQNAIFVEWP